MFPFGASYSPLIYPESDWDRDLSLMQSAGMTLIRAGDVHGSWDRIEPQENTFKFDLLENFYAKAEKYGIQILLSNGASSPPLWLATMFPDVTILSSRGERYPLAASYHWACIHHPGYLEKLERYTRKLAMFAVRQFNHFGWQISNEIGFPFMPARDLDRLGLYCYCDHCKEKFRTWVRGRYRDLDVVTHQWSWSTTSFVYNSWEEVDPPESLPSSWSGVTRWIDWRLFWQEAFADFAGWQHRVIKEIDKEHPTSVNTFNFKGFDRFGTFMGLDQWQIAEQVDHIGYDLYPGSGNKLASRPEHSSIFLDHGRSISEFNGKDFWVHEIESGPIGGWLMGPNHNTDGQDVLNYTVECLGHGGKALLYMPWREWAYQPLRWGALVDLDSTPTVRYDEIKPFGEFIQNNSDFLRVAKPPRARVAIIESKPNAIFLRGVGDEELLFRAQRGTYRAFWDKGFSVDFIDASRLSPENMSMYEHILLPLIGLLTMQQASILADFVKNGGVLYGFSRLATLDENGWYHRQFPLPDIGMVFGLTGVASDTEYGGKISFLGKEYSSHLNRDKIIVSDKCDVVAKFSDGHPAVTVNQYGKGYGVYFATQADGGYVSDPRNFLLADVINELLKKQRGLPDYFMDGSGERAITIDPHILEHGKKTILLFSNYSHQNLSVDFSLPHKSRRPQLAMEVFPKRANTEFVLVGETFKIRGLAFCTKEVKAIEIIWS